MQNDNTISIFDDGRGIKLDDSGEVRGVPQHALTTKPNDSQISHGTQIILKTDSEIFEDTAFSKEKLQNWVNDNYSELADKVSISY